MNEKHPPETLRVFPPLWHCFAMRAVGRSQRGGAALARLPWPWARQFLAPQAQCGSVKH